MPKVELVKAKAFEIDPAKKYIIVLDRQDIDMSDVESTTVGRQLGAKDSIAIVTSNKGSVKVVEL